MSHSSVRGEGAPAHAPGGIPGAASGTPGTVPGPRGPRRLRGPVRPAGRRGRRVLRGIAIALSVIVLATAGAGYLYYRHLNGNIRTDALNLGDRKLGGSRPNAFGQTPLNILLIGSDARDDVKNQELGGARDTFGGTPLADVQMLLHVSADRSNMSVVSMPRDTLLKLPKCTGTDGKTYEATQGRRPVNESLGRGGPGCTVATWQELTGIPIDHFMMIDFKGVVAMADAIGGVPVCVKQNVHSRNREGKGSGLKLAKGTHPIKGVQALQWLRTRYGFEDGSDIGRAHAQHMYMNSMARQFRQNAKLSNPLKLHSLAEAATRAMVVDPGLDRIDLLYDLSVELKKVPTGRITMTTMPWVGSTSWSGKVEPDAADAQKLFTMVRDDIPLDGKPPAKATAAATTPPPADPAAPAAEIPVMVRNATSGKDHGEARVRGRASDVVTLLTGKGFTKAKADTEGAAEDTTVIRYATADQAGDAQAVATALGLPASAVQRSTDVSGVTLFVGKDWREGDKPAPPAPAPSKAPDTARPLNGDDDGACMDIQPGFTW
ncbi:LCP family protein [Streptomyces sp. NRRL S-87]|uniref:LCP family protein n=1 Tax=Streptomyces sp. NRRL S-87 TaxID=1463920 RepID=UPI001F1AEA11|nr:LCP family protein [Streptomyces sp. NRRL S-87]